MIHLFSSGCVLQSTNVTGGKQYTYLHSISGRSPMQKVGDHFCFMDRDGKTINIHEISKSSTFKPLGKIQQVKKTNNKLLLSKFKVK